MLDNMKRHIMTPNAINNYMMGVNNEETMDDYLLEGQLMFRDRDKDSDDSKEVKLDGSTVMTNFWIINIQIG